MRDMKTVREVVQFFNENQSTLKETAKKFGISKTTVYIYLTEVMPNEVSARILMKNKNSSYSPWLSSY